MAEDKKKGNITRSAGRYGPRYGRVARKRIADIEDEMNDDHECPECGEDKVSRTDTGIWECRKCGYRFTGGAYSVETPAGKAVQRSIKEATGEEEQ